MEFYNKIQLYVIKYSSHCIERQRKSICYTNLNYYITKNIRKITSHKKGIESVLGKKTLNYKREIEIIGKLQ